MLFDGFGVHFRNDERHLWVHAPVAALVDDDAAALDGPGDKILRDRIGRAADRQYDAFERLGLKLLNAVLFALEFDRAAGGAGRGEERDLLVREVALLEHGTDELTHGAGGADNGDRFKHGW